jgi:translation initiation factor IF-1
MFAESAFQVEGVVTTVMTARTARVRLANGHELLGFVPGGQKLVGLEAGCRVKLQLTPYDLSEGRILEKRETI